MNAAILLPLLGVFIGGMLLSTQAPINAALASALGDPVLAAGISFGVGFAVLAAIGAARGTWPGAGAVGAVPWWGWTGGILGSFYVTAVIWGLPRLGVLTTVGAIVLGQVVAALFLDAIGAFGLPVQGISWQRLTAAALILVGLLLSRAG